MKMIRHTVVLALSAAVMLGCEAPPKQPETLQSARREITGMGQDDAYGRLAETAQKGQMVGDLVKPDPRQEFAIHAESIVVGLQGRGTRRIAPKLRPHLVKLLVKACDSLDVASQIINSKDAAPVRCTAVLHPFAQREDKIDLKVEAYDPTVNLEGGTLIDTPMERYMNLPKAVGDFRTRSGLVSQGVQAYARGDVTLNPGYRKGTRIGSEVPNVGYLPGGVLIDKTWGYRFLLNKPDASTGLLVEAAIRRRFGQTSAVTPHTSFVAVALPRLYKGYWKRYVDVLLRIHVRPPSHGARLAHTEKLARALGSGNRKVRYDAECTLEAYGRESAPALLSVVQSGSPVQRQSALRVLAFVRDQRAVEPLIAESRSATGQFRAESAHLMTFLGGGPVKERLVEMLSDRDAPARYRALLALEKLGVREADVVRNYYAANQRNFVMHLVDAPGERAVVVKSSDGVRRIALFGTDIRVKSGFRGGVGPVSIQVGKDATEIRHKRRAAPAPLSVRTVELQNVVIVLDRMGVSINDILGLIALMDRERALNAKVHWME